MIQFKRGNAQDFKIKNPILAAGQPGYEKDTGKLKIGNGETAWNNLNYVTPDADEMIAEASVATDDTLISYGSEDPTVNTKGAIYLQEVADTTEQELLDKYYPIGSIYICSSNINPNTTLGGVWELVDKTFSNVTYSAEGFTINSTNASSNKVYWSRHDHSIDIIINLANNVSLTDDTVTLGTFDYEKMGLTRLMYTAVFTAVCDAQNGAAILTLDNETGKLTCVDTFPSDFSATSSPMRGAITQGLPLAYMLDSACDKFYFKRIA